MRLKENNFFKMRSLTKIIAGLTLALTACGEKEKALDRSWLEQQNIVDYDGDGQADLIGSELDPLYIAKNAYQLGILPRANTRVMTQEIRALASEIIKERN